MTRRSHTALILGILLGIFLPVATLGAAPSRADKATARRFVSAAKRHIQLKQLPKAVEAFEMAYKQWPRKEIQFNIALVYLEMGERVKAYEHLSRYWRVSSPEERSRLPAPLLRLRNELGTLRVRASDGDLSVRIDGIPRGKGNIEAVLEPGIHTVEILSGDEVVQRKVLRVSGGAEVLWEAEPPRPAGAGIKGPTTSPKPPDRRRLHLGYFVAAASLAVVAGAVVVGTGVKTLQVGEDYDANPTRALQKEGRTLRAVTNVMIGVSAAAAVTAAVLVFFTRFTSPERSPATTATPATTVLPTVAPGGGGVTLELSF